MLYAYKTPHNYYIHKCSKMSTRSWYYTDDIEQALVEDSIHTAKRKRGFWNKRVEESVMLSTKGMCYWQGSQIPGEILELVQVEIKEI